MCHTMNLPGPNNQVQWLILGRLSNLQNSACSLSIVLMVWIRNRIWEGTKKMPTAWWRAQTRTCNSNFCQRREKQQGKKLVGTNKTSWFPHFLYFFSQYDVLKTTYPATCLMWTPNRDWRFKEKKKSSICFLKKLFSFFYRKSHYRNQIPFTHGFRTRSHLRFLALLQT